MRSCLAAREERDGLVADDRTALELLRLPGAGREEDEARRRRRDDRHGPLAVRREGSGHLRRRAGPRATRRSRACRRNRSPLRRRPPAPRRGSSSRRPKRRRRRWRRATRGPSRRARPPCRRPCRFARAPPSRGALRRRFTSWRVRRPAPRARSRCFPVRSTAQRAQFGETSVAVNQTSSPLGDQARPDRARPPLREDGRRPLPVDDADRAPVVAGDRVVDERHAARRRVRRGRC